MKLMIMLKQSDADSLGGEILESLGMTRNKADPKRFGKHLGITELMNKFSDMTKDGEEADDKVSGATRSYRRRIRRKMHPTDFLLYEDNSLYALPFIEPLTDRGIKPMRVQLITDSTAGETPIGASAEGQDAEPSVTRFNVSKLEKAKQYMVKNRSSYAKPSDLAEAAALELDLYTDHQGYEIPAWVVDMAEEVKPVDPTPTEDPVGRHRPAWRKMLHEGTRSASSVVRAGKPGLYQLSHHAENYADQVGMIAQNNYGEWVTVEEAEDFVRRAINEFAESQKEDVLESFSDDDVKAIVEQFMFIDEGSPYADKEDESADQEELEDVAAAGLRDIIGNDWNKYSGARTENGKLVVWIEGHPKHNVDTLWQPLTEMMARRGHPGLMEPYDNVTLVFSPDTSED